MRVTLALTIAVSMAMGCNNGGGSGDSGTPDATSGMDAGCTADVATASAYDGSFGSLIGAVPGNDGRLSFDYQSGDLFPYSYRAMMTGTHETILGSAIAADSASNTGFIPDVTGQLSQSGPLTVTSTLVARQCCTMSGDAGSSCNDLPTGAGCGMCSGQISSSVSVAVRALAAGDTVLRLVSAAGTEVEALNVSVRDPAMLRADQYIPDTGALTPATSVSIPAGQTIRIRTGAFDSTGTQLEARYGITYTSSNPSICGVREPGFSLSPTYTASVDSFDAEVKGVAAGTAMLTISAGNMQVQVAITVN